MINLDLPGEMASLEATNLPIERIANIIFAYVRSLNAVVNRVPSAEDDAKNMIRARLSAERLATHPYKSSLLPITIEEARQMVFKEIMFDLEAKTTQENKVDQFHEHLNNSALAELLVNILMRDSSSAYVDTFHFYWSLIEVALQEAKLLNTSAEDLLGNLDGSRLVLKKVMKTKVSFIESYVNPLRFPLNGDKIKENVWSVTKDIRVDLNSVIGVSKTEAENRWDAHVLLALLYDDFGIKYDHGMQEIANAFEAEAEMIFKD